MNERKGLLLLLSHWDMLGKLPPVEFKNVMQAVFSSAGANCDMPDDMSLLEQIAFEAINKDVQWSFDQYEKTRAKRAEAGRKGGLKKAENAKKQVESCGENDTTPSSKNLANSSNDVANSSKASNATFAKQNLNDAGKCVDPFIKQRDLMVRRSYEEFGSPEYMRLSEEMQRQRTVQNTT